MDQGERLPKWFTIGVLVIFTGFIAGIYDFIFLRHLLEHNVLLGAILVFVFNLFAFLTYRSYYMTVVTSPIFNAADFNNQYHGEIDQIKAYAKKSNAILHTRRLRKNRYLFDTSQVKQQQLAYCDDITDLFDNQQKINQQINEDSQQANNLQGGGEGEKQKISYVNEPNDDFEGRRQQIQQNAQADITVGGVSNQQDAEVFSQEDYQKFDQIHDLTQVKYCFKCQSVKLPRVHHCKICNRCVSRMDHHCPWVGNCVGKENQKFFCLLLFYGGLCGMIVAISVFTDYMFYDQVIVKQMSDTEHQYTTVAGSASFPSFLVAYGMFLYQVYISLNNLTTLETNVDGIYERNPFSKSSKIENLKEVFGERVLYWLLPFHETEEKQKDEGFIQLVRD